MAQTIISAHGFSANNPALDCAPIRQRTARACEVFGLILLSYFLFFHGLGNRELSSSHEARAAQDAQSILLDHAWGLPHLFDRKVELQKPPLYYWLVAGIAYLRGGTVDAWSVRAPAALAGLAGVLFVYPLGIRRGRPPTGFVAAAVLATAFHYTWLARTGRIDMALACAVTVAAGSFFMNRGGGVDQNHGSRWWLLLAYVAMALGVLLKGPIGALLPAVIGIAYLIVERELPSPFQTRAWLRLIHGLGIWWGVPLVLGLTLPWFVWANARTDGELFWTFLWKHNFERGLGDGALRSHPWWFYGPRLAFDMLPWSILLPLAAWLFMRSPAHRNDPEGRFGLVWLLSGFVLLSCVSFKRADYLLPIYPGAALFLGSVLQRWYRGLDRQKAVAVAFGVALCALPAGWTVYADQISSHEGGGKETRQLAGEIRRRAPSPQLVLFFRTEAHALAFHVGRPIDTLLEWENLDVWASRSQSYYVVMPATYARAWSRHLKLGRLEEVLCSSVLAGAYHDDPLVLFRTMPGAAPISGR